MLPSLRSVLTFVLSLFGPSFLSQAIAQSPNRPPTFCNPLDLDYRFQLQEESRREAADPVIVYFQGEYWLFASKSGGYWHSKDFQHWKLVQPTGLPLEDYAPTVEIIGGKIYFTAGSCKGLFTTNDPAKGEWSRVADIADYTDPNLFADDDGRVYMFYGCSDKTPIRGVELDPKQFSPIGQPVDLLTTDPLTHGWETKNPLASIDDLKKGHFRAYLEGAWMTKHHGKYYLQYSAPGTELSSYADGVFVSDKPLGPYRYADYNPFSQKETGFATGVGHGNTFQDASGKYWHSTCMIIGVKKMFERRLCVFPAGFVPSGDAPDQLVCQTHLGHYPQFVPGFSPDPLKENRPGWMLLSYHKKAKASTSLEKYPPELAFDENIRTWWSAATGNAGEWLSVDLGKRCEIQSIQLNFADQDSTAMGRLNDANQYIVEISDDASAWTPCVDRKENTRDAPHEYIQLDAPAMARYVRITNVHTPGQAKFSLSGLRIFGNGLGKKPERVTTVTTQRLDDKRRATVSWTAASNTDFYIIRYGIAPDRLYSNLPVYEGTSANLVGLNADANYYMTVDTVNDSGITQGGPPSACPIQ